VTELNDVIHQSGRLRIMAALCALGTETQMDFRSLGTMLKMTDGNLGAHLAKLEQAGYVKVDKTFVDRKPRTFLSVTAKGRSEFETHVNALKQILNG
jgi:DNA-binding MarR family transcriptional regulator